MVQIEASVERDAADTEYIWSTLQQIIQDHKQELLAWNIDMVSGDESLTPEKREIEKKSFAELLLMTPNQVGQLVKDYYIVTRSSQDSGLWNPIIEAQRHYITNIISRVREQKW